MTVCSVTEVLAFNVSHRDQKLNEILVGNSSACREVSIIGYILMVASGTAKFLGINVLCTLG